MKTLTAVLFAGGQSRRMGTDKATLLWDGQPFWRRQLTTLRRLKPERVLISARTTPSWCPPEIEFVPDESPSRGPLSGLAAALERIQTTHLLALAIDLPRMTPGHLGKLWALAWADCGVAPARGGVLEPLCAIYPVAAAGVARPLLADGDASLRNFVRSLAARKLIQFRAVSDAEAPLYQNVNTASEFRRAIQAGTRSDAVPKTA